MAWDDNRRVPVQCTDCGSVYVAVERRDGTITRFGTTDICSECGGNDYEAVGEGGADGESESDANESVGDDD